jgi:hypothetical protein
MALLIQLTGWRVTYSTVHFLALIISRTVAATHVASTPGIFLPYYPLKTAVKRLSEA